MRRLYQGDGARKNPHHLGQKETPVHVDGDAGDVARVVRGEKGDDARDVLRRGDAAKGSGGFCFLPLRIAHLLKDALGADDARGDGVHVDVVGAELAGEVARESDDGGLGARIVRPLEHAGRAARDGGEIDDFAALCSCMWGSTAQQAR